MLEAYKMPDSPGKLIAMIIGGGALGAATLVLSRFVVPHGSIPALLLCLVLLIASAACVYVGSDNLREGMRNERWPEESIAGVRSVVEHPAWMWSMLLLFFVMFAIGVAQFQGGRLRGWFWAVFLLLQAQTQIGNAVRRPQQPVGSGARIDWAKVLPIHSDHWGER